MRLGAIFSVRRGSGVSGWQHLPGRGWAHREGSVYRGMILNRESLQCNCSLDKQVAQLEEQPHMMDTSWLVM